MAHLPYKRIALWAVVLNGLWEFVQCVFLYDMSGWGFWRATAWMWGATAGDVVIVMAVVSFSARLVGYRHLVPMDRTGWLAMLGVGLVAGVLLEWLAIVLELWTYSPLMPTITVAGHPVGLSPIVQITALPALCMYIAARPHTS